MEPLGVAANIVSVVDLSVKVIGCCAQYAQDIRNAENDKARLLQEVTRLNVASQNARDLLEGSQSARLKASKALSLAVEEGKSQLRQLEEPLSTGRESRAASGTSFHVLKWPFQRKDVEAIVQDLRRCTQAIDSALQIDQTAILLDIDQRTVLDRLPLVEGASFDSHAEEHNPTCLPETRVDLLQQISEWAKDPCAEPIFWLNGMAGTGKSTISRTLARSFAETGRLGASFFFKRGEADRGSLSKFFTTIAAQMVVREPAITPHVKAAIDMDPNISGRALREQFEKLITQPLSKIAPGSRNELPLVVVVDALDECDRDDDIRLIINLFSRTKTMQPQRLRILVTSRPDIPIRLGFKAVTGTYQDLILHEIPQLVIEHDICAFLEHELARIRDDYNASVPQDRQLCASWPGQPSIQTLVSMAIPLFIFAATVCRFVADRRCGSPDEQLKDVLRFQTRSQESQLDATYLPILNKLILGLSNKQRDNVLERFREIVGSIVVLASPLSTYALGRILDMSKATIDGQLDMLHSVLSVPSSAEPPVRLLHLSFRDFLLDSEKEGKNLFWVDEKQAHDRMATNCIRVMNSFLGTDVCSIAKPGTNRFSINPDVINSRLPAEVQYACLYWGYHIEQAKMVSDGNDDDDDENDDKVYGFLSHHFLHWVEALSLGGSVSESLSIMKTLQFLPSPKRSTRLAEFLEDATRFMQANMSIIDSTPLQLYSSVLAFTPKNSVVRKMFWKQIPEWISLPPEPEDDWDQCQQILEGHKDTLMSAVFSHDSTLIVSASCDKTVRVWRVDGGECIQELKGHTGSVLSATFSPDSTLIASASDDETVRVWRVDSGECIQELKGHTSSVWSATFSPDSTLIASASLDKTIRIWRVDGGKFIQELNEHTSWVSSVAFSHDSTLIVSASGDKTARVWRVDGGECIQELEGHRFSVTSAAFSPDSTLIASVSLDKTVRVWRVDGGESIQEIHLGISSCRSRLLTDVGTISVQSLSTFSGNPTPAISHSHSCFEISEDSCWIMWRKRRVFWLPVAFRPVCSAISGSTVAIGCESGRVIITTFCESRTARVA